MDYPETGANAGRVAQPWRERPPQKSWRLANLGLTVTRARIISTKPLVRMRNGLQPLSGTMGSSSFGLGSARLAARFAPRHNATFRGAETRVGVLASV